MYAVVKIGGHQYVVRPGDLIEVQRLKAEPGQEIELRDILMLKTDDGKVLIGNPTVEAKVILKVLEHTRGPKIRGFKYRAKKRYRRRWGHRQELTKVKVEKLEI